MWVQKKKHTPYLYARWEHPDGSGKIVSKSTGEVGERAAKAKGTELEAEFLAEWQREQRGGHVLAETVIAEYWDTEAHKLKSGTDHIFPHLARIKQFLGDRPYCDVTIADVARFVDLLDGKVSDSTINRALSVWRRMHNVAWKKRLYPVQAIDWSSVRRDEPDHGARQITRDQLAAIIERLPIHCQEIVAFDMATGARKSQVLTLTWDRVDLQAHTAIIWRKHRKARAPHVIPLSDAAMAVLERRAAARASNDPSEPVFNTRNFRKHWDKAVMGAGLTGVRFHDLRHTVGFELASKASVAVVQHLFGHSSITTTQRYTKAQREDVALGVARLKPVKVGK